MLLQWKSPGDGSADNSGGAAGTAGARRPAHLGPALPGAPSGGGGTGGRRGETSGAAAGTKQARLGEQRCADLRSESAHAKPKQREAESRTQAQAENQADRRGAKASGREHARSWPRGQKPENGGRRPPTAPGRSQPGPKPQRGPAERKGRATRPGGAAERQRGRAQRGKAKPRERRRGEHKEAGPRASTERDSAHTRELSEPRPEARRPGRGLGRVGRTATDRRRARPAEADPAR